MQEKINKFLDKYINNLKVNLKFKLIILVLLAFLAGLDLFTKLLADDVLKTQTITVIDGFFNFALAYNTGVSFSMFNDLANGQVILASLAIIVGLFLIDVILYSLKKIDIVGYALIAAGAFGNGIDRALHGHVIDFLDFHYKSWHYPTFNLADCYIFIGVFILLFGTYIFDRKKSKSV